MVATTFVVPLLLLLLPYLSLLLLLLLLAYLLVLVLALPTPLPGADGGALLSLAGDLLVSLVLKLFASSPALAR